MCARRLFVCARSFLPSGYSGYGANAKAPRFDTQSHFTGQGKNHMAVAPALVAHVAGELRDEAAVAKERSKAREEASMRNKK